MTLLEPDRIVEQESDRIVELVLGTFVALGSGKTVELGPGTFVALESGKTVELVLGTFVGLGLGRIVELGLGMFVGLQLDKIALVQRKKVLEEPGTIWGQVCMMASNMLWAGRRNCLAADRKKLPEPVLILEGGHR